MTAEECPKQRYRQITDYARQIGAGMTELDEQIIFDVSHAEMIALFVKHGIPLRVAKIMADQYCLGGMALAHIQLEAME